MTIDINELVNHLKETGFVYPGSQIYGGLANSWDYGPLGVALKNNLKNLWWRTFVNENPLNVGLDSSIILNSKIWSASGHIGNFNDPLIECKNCHHRFRADKLIQDRLPHLDLYGKTHSQLKEIIDREKITCKSCRLPNFSNIQQFDLMFKTKIGPVANSDSDNEVYLRPETAQGIFVNFKVVQRSMRKMLPFGIGQIGKSFRNEITPGNFIFRTREFEQMELEFFYSPEDKIDWFDYWLREMECFLREKINLNPKNYRLKETSIEDLVHYAKRTVDMEYHFPFGWEELWGLSNRGDYDLTNHQKYSGEDLSVLDTKTNKKIIPYVIEPSVGVERLMLALLCESFKIEKTQSQTDRLILKLPINLAPYQIAILPLQKAQNDLSWNLYSNLLNDGFIATYDDKGSIGKRYRRQDAIGTPLAITVDFNSQSSNRVTIRYRDTMKQEVVAIVDLPQYLRKYLI